MKGYTNTIITEQDYEKIKAFYDQGVEFINSFNMKDAAKKLLDLYEVNPEVMLDDELCRYYTELTK